MWFWKRSSAASVVEPSCERRASQRYDARGTPVEVGWFDEEGEGHSVPGALKDLSSGGAMVWTKVAPPSLTGLAIRLAWGDCNDVMTADVVRLVEAPAEGLHGPTGGGFTLHLRFVEPCTYDFFKAAISGFVTERRFGKARGTIFDAKDWR
jgi:hypothetical protein